MISYQQPESAFPFVQIGDKIQIKRIQELTPYQKWNVTIEYPNKQTYLNRQLTVEKHCFDNELQLWYFVVTEDFNEFRWYESFLVAEPYRFLPTLKTNQRLPLI